MTQTEPMTLEEELAQLCEARRAQRARRAEIDKSLPPPLTCWWYTFDTQGGIDPTPPLIQNHELSRGAFTFHPETQARCGHDED